MSASLPAGDNAHIAGRLVDRVAADNTITATMASLKNAPPVTLIESFDELPQAVQDEAKEQEAGEREFKGALKAGHIWILRANHATVEDIEATLFHELYGHCGARVRIAVLIVATPSMWKAGYTERASAKASSATLGRKPGSACPRAGAAFFCCIRCYRHMCNIDFRAHSLRTFVCVLP